MTDNKLADAIAARDAAIQQAQIWKMEAQTANATIAEIYRLVGSKAGNWNGAKPVREALAAQDVRDTKPPANGEVELPPNALTEAVDVLLGMGYQWLSGTWTPYLPVVAPGSDDGAHNRLAAIAALQQPVPDVVHAAVVRLKDRTFPAHECPAESSAVWNVALYELESALTGSEGEGNEAR